MPTNYETHYHEHLVLKDMFRIHTIYTAFERHYDYDYVFRGERHNFWELVLVVDGQIGVTAENDILTLTKGQAFLHKPMEFHKLWNVENCQTTIIVFSFAADNMPECSSRLFELKDISVAQNVLWRIRSSFDFHVRNVVGVKPDCETKSQIALKYLETFILDTLTRQSNPEEITQSRSMKNYANIISVLEKNIHNNLSVPELAEICNMSEINLKQTFSRYAGMGVKNYFNRLKINAAIPMLQAGSTVQEVSDAFGFSSQNYFCTVFKRITGHAPSFYR